MRLEYIYISVNFDGKISSARARYSCTNSQEIVQELNEAQRAQLDSLFASWRGEILDEVQKSVEEARANLLSFENGKKE